MRLQLHKPHVDHSTSKEKEKGKLMVKSAVTLRALNTFFSTQVNRHCCVTFAIVWKQKKDCFCLQMWRDLNKTLGVHFIEVSVKRELIGCSHRAGESGTTQERNNQPSKLPRLPFELWEAVTCYLPFPRPPSRASLVSSSRAPKFPLLYPILTPDTTATEIRNPLL